MSVYGWLILVMVSGLVASIALIVVSAYGELQTMRNAPMRGGWVRP